MHIICMYIVFTQFFIIQKKKKDLFLVTNHQVFKLGTCIVDWQRCWFGVFIQIQVSLTNSVKLVKEALSTYLRGLYKVPSTHQNRVEAKWNQIEREKNKKLQEWKELEFTHHWITHQLVIYFSTVVTCIFGSWSIKR